MDCQRNKIWAENFRSQGIYYNEEVVASPKNESDDDIPLRRIQLSHQTSTQQHPEDSEPQEVIDVNDIELPAGEAQPNMERRSIVIFLFGTVKML